MRLRCGPDSCAGQHFVEDAAERVDIRAGIGRFAFPLLRRHVGGRAHHHAAGGDRFILARFRQSEIQNLDAGFRDHDVAGLEIAVNDALAVRLGQRGQRSARHRASAVFMGSGPLFSRAAIVSPSTSSITR